MLHEPSLYMKVSMIPSGFLTLPEHFFCADQQDKTVRNLVPSMSFLLQHPRSGMKILFDLGLRRNLDDYPHNIHPHLKTRQPIHTVPDVRESLLQGGLDSRDIDVAILSHVHYDHVGTPRDFTRATFIVGYGTNDLLLHGMNYHSAAHFEKDLLPPLRTVELPNPSDMPAYTGAVAHSLPPMLGLDRVVPEVSHSWKPLPPFDNAIDVFGDGLLYIVDSPGHLQGHLNVLARVAEARWVYLAGDACHHSRILDGSTDIATWEENGMVVCIHADKELAADTVARIRSLREEGFRGGKVEVVLAHDAKWYEEHQYSIWPSHI
ncbi:hypothetical protein EYZ11_012332 [Aspergillus tanneri]|uniref:Metallo-beta-lactamase domain-containing protein n=1 Tax=Aspergillus tanneri TaxID=1220188 RepID=A0A4S3J2L2_9EURO|nr:uncharacterized protein ATNIH1004_001721 [Aspergillus tanneri]KAA8652814.1 hypothetical protein ATNIH1004_001721 [Aspergillus tanneri]THC88217.1 hypothetical protein EYZ11_012332 [Aspergillus tanneri]